MGRTMSEELERSKDDGTRASSSRARKAANGSGARQKSSAATGERRSTEVLLEEAALSLLEEEGVLAGLSLQEVATRAEVNRALMYHYYSSKRDLLRAAIRREMASGGEKERTPDTVMSLGKRVSAGLKRALKYKRILHLTTLLHLDGSTAPKLMPNARSTLVVLDRDRLAGKIPAGADLPGLHAAYAALTYGYVLYREVLARDLEIEPAELDGRVFAEVERIFDCAPLPDERTRGEEEES